MIFFILKAACSGVLIAGIATVARTRPVIGGLLAALPLVSIIAMLWLWHDTHDGTRIEQLARATFWFVLPSLPLFLIMAAALRAGMGFYPALGIGCAVSIVLYLVMTYFGPSLNLRL